MLDRLIESRPTNAEWRRTLPVATIATLGHVCALVLWFWRAGSASVAPPVEAQPRVSLVGVADAEPPARHSPPPPEPAGGGLHVAPSYLPKSGEEIQPGMRRGLDLQAPPTTTEKQPAASIDRIVLHVATGPAYTINGDAVAQGTLAPRLQALFAARSRRVLFVQGEGRVPFGDVIGAVDIARGAGVEVVGLVPRPDTTGRAKRETVVRPVKGP